MTDHADLHALDYYRTEPRALLGIIEELKGLLRAMLQDKTIGWAGEERFFQIEEQTGRIEGIHWILGLQLCTRNAEIGSSILAAISNEILSAVATLNEPWVMAYTGRIHPLPTNYEPIPF